MGGLFDLENKKKEIRALEEETKEKEFWNNIERANNINQKLGHLKKEVANFEGIQKEIEEDYLILENDAELEELVASSIKDLEVKIKELETSVILNGEFDGNDCYLEIHPGAGGTESCDWASMLLL